MGFVSTLRLRLIVFLDMWRHAIVLLWHISIIAIPALAFLTSVKEYFGRGQFDPLLIERFFFGIFVGNAVLFVLIGLLVVPAIFLPDQKIRRRYCRMQTAKQGFIINAVVVRRAKRKYAQQYYK